MKRGIYAVVFGFAAFILLFLLVGQSSVHAASECYLKCFTTDDGTRVCVVEGHRLYGQITVRVENGDQCFSSVEQGRAAGFLVLGAPTPPAEAPQAAPEAVPVEATATPEPIAEETPEPAADMAPEITEPESPSEVEAPNSPDVVDTPEETVEGAVEEAPLVPMPNDTSEESSTKIPYESGYENELDMLLGNPVGLAILAGMLVLLILYFACWWIVFSKADVPGWLSLIPIVNLFFTVKISGKPVWWLILCFIPLVNMIFWVLICLGLAARFGKGALVGLLLFFMFPLGLLILAFSGEYQG